MLTTFYSHYLISFAKKTIYTENMYLLKTQSKCYNNAMR